MDKNLSELLEIAGKASMDKIISEYNGSYNKLEELRSLDKDEIDRLSHKILALPDRFIGVLFFKYVFKADEQTTGDILGQSNINGCVAYANELLSRSMGLPRNTGISDESMVTACKAALARYVEEAIETAPAVEPSYSRKFRKNLKAIKSVRRMRSFAATVIKRIAVFFFVSLIGFAVTLSVNAEFRERFFSWLINVFPEFSEFGAYGHSVPLEELRFEDLEKYMPLYIPEGFGTVNAIVSDPYIIYEYADKNGKNIFYKGHLPTGTSIFYDSKGEAAGEFYFKGHIGYLWEDDGFIYLIWQQEGFEFSITADIEKEEVIRIAESVAKIK